ncbi:MAG: aminoacetone oxidase family FAD-binding enzyme [Patescibacteria group bacterium]
MKPGYDVIVVGGGAAGMMAAGRAAERGKRVLLLEKNVRLGQKLSITGGGRCNITNAEENPRLFLAHYGKAEKFLYSAFTQFGVLQTLTFFANHSLPIVVQAGQRAFPKTEKATDVVKALEKYLQEGKVEVRTKTSASSLLGKSGRVEGIVAGNQTLTAKSYILATGGQSHPETGSTGDGFKWLAKLDHQVVPPTPTIVPLAVADAWVQALAGVALDDVKITFYVDSKKQLALKGRILCTHFGLSGPLILNAAGKVGDMLHAGTVTAAIDAFPKMDLGSLDKYITKIFDENKNKTFKTVFRFFAPTGSASELQKLLPNTMVDKKVHSVSKEERKVLVNLLKALPITVTGLMGYEWAVVADGGLPMTAVDGKTMQSRLYPNLFVTGDLLDIRRPSGGYSLQLCWTTGYVAGSHA